MSSTPCRTFEFDRAAGLHSFAARHGARAAILLARVFHAIAVALFLFLWVAQLFPVGRLYLAGVLVAAALLVYENWAVRHAAAHGLELRVIDVAFFRANIGVSLSLFALCLLDRLTALAAGAS